MLAVNHFVTGVAIGTAISNPLIAVPVAFASHFLLDVLPHYGEPYMKRASGPIFKAITVIDAIVLAVCFIWLVQVASLWAVVAGFAAMSPDLVWIYRFIVQEKWGKLQPGPANTLNRFHAGIQWGERPWGWIFELAFFAIIVYVVALLT